MTKIIAEVGQNHEGNFDNAVLLIDKAAEAGADIIKLQYWNVDKIYRKEDQRYIPASQRSLPFGDILRLLDYIKDEKHKTACVSFFGLTDFERFIRPDSKYSKDVIIKFANTEVDTFLKYKDQLCKAGAKIIVTSEKDLGFKRYKTNLLSMLIANPNVGLLIGKPEYPAQDYYEEIQCLMKLSCQSNLRNRVGLSDHTVGTDWTKAGIAMGLAFIEKHFTDDSISKNSTFRDHQCSINCEQMKEVIAFRDSVYDKESVQKDQEGKRRCKNA